MALPPQSARRALVLALLSAVLAGCGSERETSRPPATVDPVAPPNLITAEYLREQVAAQSDPEPVETVLRFWRELQYGNFVRAYDRLGEELRAVTSYRRFVDAFHRAVPLFLVRPRVQSVETDGGLTTVYLLIQQGPRPAVTDPPTSFNLRKEDGEWRIVTDPRNVLGTPVGS